MKLVSIITVNFNQPRVTEELLASITAININIPIEIIVVDNGSIENYVPQWEAAYPEFIFIRSETNLGFAGGNNVGIKAAKGDCLFLVNNDTEFTHNLVEILVNTLEEHPATAIVSPKIHYFTDKEMIQYAGFTKMNFFTCRNSCIGQFEKDSGQYNNASGPTAFAHGAAMLIRTSALKKAGLMAENFFLYYEEMDWCESFKRAGYTIEVNMHALIFHKESISVGKNSVLKEYFMNRNRILFIRRNANGFQKLIFGIYFLAVVTPRNILSYIKNKQEGFTLALIKAIWWNVTHAVNSDDLGWPVKR
ncbi:MAG TPA: glycosyltransferase family 2 protein [Chitinophagaceae bacterium]|nr:glycosyltransferase family 2 protein [Chitinophagaceae bacterium]